MDSQHSVAEGGQPRRRILKRATGLLTTKGQPVPAIAETVLRVETASSSPPTTPMSHGTHRRAHSNSVPVVTAHASASTSAPPGATGALSRRRSDGSASLGLGGSIRRTLKGVSDVSSRLVRSTSRSRSKDGRGEANNTGVPPNLSSRQSSEISTDTAQSPTRRRASIKGHIRSYSDVLWKRPPRIAKSLSEPVFLPDHPDSLLSGMETTTPPVQVGSPEDMSSPLSKPAPVIEEHFEDPAEQPPKRPLSTIHEPPPPPPVITTTAAAPKNDVEPPTPLSPQSPTSATDDVPIPPLLLNGVPMLKVSAKKQKRYFFRLDPDEGQIIFQSKKLRISAYPVRSVPLTLLTPPQSR